MFAEKVAVLAHVWAKSCRAAIECNLAEQTAAHQHTEAIINGGEGNFGHAPLHPLKNLIGGGVIVTIGDYFENFLALPGETKAS